MTSDGSGFGAPTRRLRFLAAESFSTTTTTSTTTSTSGGSSSSQAAAPIPNLAPPAFVLGQEYLDPEVQAVADAKAANGTRANTTAAAKAAAAIVGSVLDAAAALEDLDAAAAAAKAAGPSPVVVKMLSSPVSAAVLSFPDWAFASANGTQAANVTVLLAPPEASSALATITLEFPSFDTLYYDPIIQFDKSVDGLAMEDGGAANVACGTGACTGKGAPMAAGNAAAAAGLGKWVGALLASVLLVLML